MAVPTPTPPEPAQPGLAKTFGVLNALLGGLLFLCGGGCLRAELPFLLDNNPLQVAAGQAEEVVEQMRRQLVIDLRASEGSTPAGPAREGIVKARTRIESQANDVASLDFAKVNADLPWVTRYLWADGLTGPPLNLALVAGGLGLAFRKNWGRVLSVWTAAAKVVRLTALAGLFAFAVVPHLGRTAREFARSELIGVIVRGVFKAQEAVSPGKHSVTLLLSAEETIRATQSACYGLAGLVLCFGAIYPVVLLIVLTRPSVRLACSGTAREGADVPPEPQPAE